MKRIKIKDILKLNGKQQEVVVKGSVRTRRGSKNVSFIALNDGSTINKTINCRETILCFQKIIVSFLFFCFAPLSSQPASQPDIG